VIVYFISGVREYTNGEKSYEPDFSADAGGGAGVSADANAGDGQAPDLNALIDLLGWRYGAGFKEFIHGEGNCFFLVNGGGIAATGGLNTPLVPGDRVEILPFVHGG